MSSISDLFHGILNIPVPFNMVVLVVMITCATGVVSSLFKQIRKYGCHRREIEFKRDLVERGLSVEEIERIVVANLSANRDSRG